MDAQLRSGTLRDNGTDPPLALWSPMQLIVDSHRPGALACRRRRRV